MAGEAISLSVRKKISDGDNILTYGWYVYLFNLLKFINIGTGIETHNSKNCYLCLSVNDVSHLANK